MARALTSQYAHNIFRTAGVSSQVALELLAPAAVGIPELAMDVVEAESNRSTQVATAPHAAAQGPQPNGSHAGWPGVAQEGVRQVGGALERHQDRASERPARPRASTLSIITAVALVFFVGGVTLAGVLAYIGHQLGADGYEARQLERHQTVIKALAAQTLAVAALTVELAAQRQALYQLIDTVEVHHPEAAKVGKQLERGTVRP